MLVSTDALIQHVSELPAYSPPAHSGTVNRRLVDREFGARFEMVLGHVAPGGRPAATTMSTRRRWSTS